MKRIGLLGIGVPVSLVIVVACGGADDPILGAGGDDGGAEATTGGDGGGTGDGAGGGDGAAIDAAQNDGGGGEGGGGDSAVDAGMGPGTYVSGSAGVDTNPGTKLLPVKTIAKGITNAIAIGGAANVYVAQGHYPEKVTMVQGISLLGGHQCDMSSCTWVRAPGMYDTAIDNQDAEGVLAGATITKVTKIDGFRVRGLAGALGSVAAACLTLDGGSPTVTNNVIAPGDVTGTGRAVGIEIFAPTVDQTGALIDSNVVQGGSSTNLWVGITFDTHPGPPPATPGVALVSNNKIRGGTAPVTVGIEAFACGAPTTFFRNNILAGTSMTPGGNAGSISWGIQAIGHATYDSNVINADQANVGTCSGNNGVCGGFISFSSTSVLTNNIIFGVKGPHTAAVLLSEAEMAVGVIVLNGNYLDGAGTGIAVSAQTVSAALQLRNCGGGNCGVNTVIGKARNNILMGGLNQLRYGVLEEQLQSRTVHPQAFEYSNIFFSAQSGRTDVLYHFWNGALATDLTTIPLILATVPNNPNNLYNVDPQVTATERLVTPTSPMIDKGTLTEAPPKDIDGNTRPRGAAIDIGANEAM